MVLIEAACVLIVAVYFVANRGDRALTRDALLVALAGFVGEDSMIRAYDYYGYAGGWHTRVDHVPLLIPAIWAPVVLSARAVARTLAAPRGVAYEALLTGALVTFDAALIEPIAVRAGLWHWNAPGVFGVPVIGIVGWGIFAAAAVLGLARLEGWARAAVIPLSVLVTHAGLLALWWGALRYVLRGPLDWRLCAVALALCSLAFTVAAARADRVLSWRELGPRAIATGFFAALLAPRVDAPLGVWAALFTPPWIVLCARALSATQRARLRTAR